MGQPEQPGGLTPTGRPEQRADVLPDQRGSGERRGGQDDGDAGPGRDAGRLDLKPWPASVAEKRFLARFAVLFAAASA